MLDPAPDGQNSAYLERPVARVRSSLNGSCSFPGTSGFGASRICESETGAPDAEPPPERGGHQRDLDDPHRGTAVPVRHEAWQRLAQKRPEVRVCVLEVCRPVDQSMKQKTCGEEETLA